MGARGHKPTKRGPPAPAKADFDDAATEIYESGDDRRAAPPSPPASSSQPMVAISMKTPADPNVAVVKPEREMPHVRLRAMSEVAKSQHPQNLGNLAPPYDPAEARARSVRDFVVWGSLAVIIASAIALVVWFVAS